ncbi:MAG: hypothetical protein ACOC05_10935 [Oceanicaulis sp.]
MGDVKSDLRALRKDVDALITHLGELAGHEVDDASRGFKGAARKAGRNAKSAAGKAAHELYEMDEELRDYIRERPLAACGAAIGAGFIGALLLRR